MNKYYNRFKDRTEEQLIQIKKALEGNPDTDPNAIEAVNRLLDGDSDIIEDEFIDIPVNSDFAIARSYLTKIKNTLSRGIGFELSFSDYKKLKNKKKCFYTNIRFEESGLNKQTIDRIDASKPYTKENTVSCTHQVNSLKNALFESQSAGINLTPSQVFLFIEKLLSAIED